MIPYQQRICFDCYHHRGSHCRAHPPVPFMLKIPASIGTDGTRLKDEIFYFFPARKGEEVACGEFYPK